MKNLLPILCLLYFAVLTSAQQTNKEKIHSEIGALRDKIVLAIKEVFAKESKKEDKEKGIEKLIALLHENVVVTWHDARVNRGRKQVKKYYDSLSIKNDVVVKSYKGELTMDDWAIIHGEDTAIAFGELQEHYEFTNGLVFDLKSRLTITLVKENDTWLIAAVHISNNLFDNALLNKQKLFTYILAVITAGVGLAIGLLIGRLRNRRT